MDMWHVIRPTHSFLSMNTSPELLVSEDCLALRKTVQSVEPKEGRQVGYILRTQYTVVRCNPEQRTVVTLCVQATDADW